jgi:hypothetical protein
MAVQERPQKRLYSRRQFLTLAGAGAVVGAFILLATKNKGISGLLKTNSGTQAGQATTGKYITTRAAGSPLTSQSFFQKLFGGKL